MHGSQTQIPWQYSDETVVEGFMIIGVFALLALIWVTRAFQRATI